MEKRFALTLTLTVLGVATFWAQPNLISLTCVIYLCGLAIAPTLIAGFSLLEAQAKPGRRTEAMSWLSSGISVGVAAGASVVGFVIDAHGPRFGYASPPCAAPPAPPPAWQAWAASGQPPVRPGVLGVFAGQGQHLGYVPGCVVVGEDGLRAGSRDARRRPHTAFARPREWRRAGY